MRALALLAGGGGGSRAWDFSAAFARHKSALFGFAVIGFFTLAAVFAPLIAAEPYVKVGVAPLLSAPSSQFPLGSDDLGRDMLAGIAYGGRVSLMVGAMSALLATLTGIGVGLLAGYAGGLVDEVFMRIVEFFQVLPRFFVALVLVAIVGSDVWVVVLVIAMLSWPLTARLIRAEVLTLRERDFVLSARVLAAPAWYIAFVEILPNALAPVVVNASLEVGRAILTEASLSFLGLADANHPSWGAMLAYGQPLMRQAWWLSVFPGAAIVLVVLGFNLVGDGLNDVLNPRRGALVSAPGA
ncbi:MAG TPA: ABC transporter permease [Ramlibacter sp.]|uniref:ABC transporter permease n=1 Tax=Ramlibacter sp. TaxID=1917967 RepID=UPI002CC7DD78|nr:ABC transporter permease [Ramlibacter sp.]HVZ43853.1 ABC transporter permease [Ramlibacter sp.]